MHLPLPGPAYAPLPAARTGAWGDYFRGLSIIVWLFLLAVSFWWFSDWSKFLTFRESGFDRNMQYIGAAAAIIAHLTLGFSVLSEQIIKFFSSVKGRLLGGFCFLALALSPLSIEPLRSALYALATLAVFLVASWAWMSDYARFRRVLFVAGVVLLAFLAALIVHHGMSKTSVGGIQRNRYAQTAMAGMLCLFLARVDQMAGLRGLGVIF